MSEKSRLHAQIEGHVQGVGFRMFVSDTARRLGLTGWVRNRWNGDVEVVAEGERIVLEKLLSALYQGPRSSYVTKITSDWLPATGEFSSFYVRSTA
jgi:acylphosphatase